MSAIRILSKQFSHYFTGHVAIMAAGFISFPLLTRIFSVADYGMLGLLTTTLLIATAVTKMGCPGYIVQWYAEFKARNEISSFYSTIFISIFAIAATLAILFYCLMQYLPEKILDKRALSVFPILSILIVTTCLTDVLTSSFRAEQRTKAYNLIAIIRRYGGTALGILFVFFFINALMGFYFGQIVAGIIIFSALTYGFIKRKIISFTAFSTKIFKDAMKFGFPLVCAELGHLFLNYADRYLIQLYLGSTSLGLYTAGYNLATYVTEAIVYPIAYAHTPIYMGILIDKGEKETKDFLTKVFRYLLLLMIPLVFGFIAIGKDLIRFLASKKYEEVYVSLVYIVVGQAFYACSMILNDGLLIRKKTYILRNVIIFACFVNVGINTILIPRYGIEGAAQATLLSNIFYVIAITYYSFKEFKFQIDYRSASLYLLSAGGMYLIVSGMDAGSPLKNLVLKIPAGVLSYCGLIFALDRDARRAALKIGKKS